MSTSAIERELKLAVSDDYTLPDLTDRPPGVALRPLESQDLEARYLDTADGALLQLGVTLRRRTGEGPTRWTLKLPGPSPAGDVLERREMEVLGDDEHPPEALREMLDPLVGETPVVEVAVVRTRRDRWAVTFGDRPLGELADDHVEGRCPARPAVRFREIELELSDQAPESVVTGVTDSLREAGAVIADAVPKLQRVLMLSAAQT